MWRLISTADHPDALRGKAFGGILNLKRALDTGIILEEKLSTTSTRTHHADSLVYHANWKAAFHKLAINVVDEEALRLYSPTSGADANQICFTVPDGHAHRFRDTFAVELLLAGIPLEQVSILLGHQSIRVTERYYAAWTDSRQRQVEADLKRAWEHDPIVLLETNATRRLRGEIEAVN
jgi:hypothetical protein